MAGAPYQFDLTLTNDETPQFSVEWTMEDGSPFPWSDYAITYTVNRGDSCCWRCDYGRPWSGGGTQNLAQGAGIAVDPTNDRFTITLAPVVGCGRYAHGCRVQHIASGALIQMFDGTLTITEGNFR